MSKALWYTYAARTIWLKNPTAMLLFVHYQQQYCRLLFSGCRWTRVLELNNHDAFQSRQHDASSGEHSLWLGTVGRLDRSARLPHPNLSSDLSGYLGMGAPPIAQQIADGITPNLVDS
jgi:hypothetical protein